MEEEAKQIIRTLWHEAEIHRVEVDDLLSIVWEWYANPFLPCSPEEVAYRVWYTTGKEGRDRAATCLAILEHAGLFSRSGGGYSIERTPVVSYLAEGFERGRFPLQRELVELEVNARLREQAGLNEARTRALMESIGSVGAGLILVDENRNLLGINRRAGELIGSNAFRSLEEMSEKLSLLFPEISSHGLVWDDAESPAWIQDETDEFRRTEVEVEGRYLRIVVGPYRMDGDTKGAIVVLMDVTGERLLTRFIGHEMKTMLGLLELHLDGIERNPECAPEIESARMILGQLSRMRRDLGDLLRMRFDIRSRISLELILADCAREYAEICAARGLRFVARYPEDFPRIVCDRERILQVVQNLLNNAVKFTPKGGAVELRAEVRSGNVEISVIDNGIGLAAEDRHRIFTPGYRVASAVEGEEIEGSGLGLALCKRIVEHHRGEIFVERREGGGCRFVVRLPLSREGAECL